MTPDPLAQGMDSDSNESVSLLPWQVEELNRRLADVATNPERRRYFWEDIKRELLPKRIAD